MGAVTTVSCSILALTHLLFEFKGKCSLEGLGCLHGKECPKVRTGWCQNGEKYQEEGDHNPAPSASQSLFLTPAPPSSVRSQYPGPFVRLKEADQSLGLSSGPSSHQPHESLSNFTNLLEPLVISKWKTMAALWVVIQTVRDHRKAPCSHLTHERVLGSGSSGI